MTYSHAPQGTPLRSYNLMLTTNAGANPLDNTTYFIGANTSFTTTEGGSRVYVPKGGTIAGWIVAFVQIIGSAEQSTLNLRVNNTTDTLLASNITNDSIYTVFAAITSIPISQGDFIELKWTTPTWVTNPTSLEITGIINITY